MPLELYVHNFPLFIYLNFSKKSLGFRVRGSGFRGFGVSGFRGFGVRGSGFGGSGVRGSGFGVPGSGFRV